jgi:response regulator RpfG family c-di-GMP phosphodiesterase
MMPTPTDTLFNPAHHRVLVVDDEEIVVVALGETLRRERYQVVTTMNPVAALEILGRETFSVIITDQQMPQLSGLELLAHARQVQPESTRILITAVLSLDTVIDAINKGEVYRFIVKPWLREELLVTVQNAAQRSELVRRNLELQAARQDMNGRLVQLNEAREQQVKLIAEQNQQLSRLNEALERNLHRSVELCLRTMETLYPRLGLQARRAHDLCQRIGERLGLPVGQRQTLEIAAWLHDFGLIGAPEELLRRWRESPKTLDREERALIEQHPAVGEELAGFAHHLKEVGPTIRAHHERFDGEGYPDRLAGEDILWLGRLLAVTVAYVSAPDDSDGIEMVKQGSGTAFDPEAVRVFLRVVPETAAPRKAKTITLRELRPGMVLAKGVYTANGFLLHPEDHPLTSIDIEKLLNHSRIQPITQSLAVYC